MRFKVDILFGGQFGSEGKGVIAAHIANRYDIHVRVGAPNAGHSFLDTDGTLYKMQTIPVGWKNRTAMLIIGRGGLLNPALFRAEVEAIAKVDPTIYGRLYVDGSCGVLDDMFHFAEGGIHGEMHARIGSTGEGVGPARVARINRDPQQFRLFRDLAMTDPFFYQFLMEDTPSFISNSNLRVLLEGAQGQGLSMIHGPWPYCTSIDPGPAQLLSDVGIPPACMGDAIACFRTYPIRVAGNSGPLYKEITWEALAERLGDPTMVPERTTVTKKIRRVGEWDPQLALQCKTLHRPSALALMFADYIDRANVGVTSWDALSEKTRKFIRDFEDFMEAPVNFIGTGGPKFSVIEI